jgi:carnosine synthase
MPSNSPHSEVALASQVLLNTESPEAEEHRRSQIRGKRFLVVSGCLRSKTPMYSRMNELGAKLVVLDGPGHWAQAAVGDGLFEGFLEVDLYPPTTLLERAYAAVTASGLPFDGVVTVDDSLGPLLAGLGQALGLPAHPPLAMAFSRDKTFTREVCRDAGIPSPRFFRIRSADQIEAAAAHVGFPAVIKPVSGVDSIGTYIVHDIDELRRRYSETVEPVRGHLKKDHVTSLDDNEIVWANGFDMTLEQFLDGEEFDLDCLLSGGEMVYSGLVYNLPQPFCKETGSRVPAPFPAQMEEEIVDFVRQCLDAMGFTDGLFHVELKYTSSGPRLLEVNARMGGGYNYEMNKLVWGVDLIEQYLMTALGIPIRPLTSAAPGHFLVEHALIAPYSGTVTRSDYLGDLRSHPNVLGVKQHAYAGNRVVGPDGGVPQWLAEFLIMGRSAAEVEQTLETILAGIEMPIEP